MVNGIKSKTASLPPPTPHICLLLSQPCEKVVTVAKAVTMQ